MRTVAFEDEKWQNFLPISLNRHVGELMIGGTRLLHTIRRAAGQEVALRGREYLAAATEERWGIDYNPEVGRDEEVLLVNARISAPGLVSAVAKGKQSRAVVANGGDVVAARLKGSEYSSLGPDGVVTARALGSLLKAGGIEKVRGSSDALFEYPWEMVVENGRFIEAPRTGSAVPRACTFRGPKGTLGISSRAEVRGPAHFDTSAGPIVVEPGATIEPFSTLYGPCFVGRESVIHAGLIEANTSIGEGCRVGGEVESSIIYPHSNKNHYGYLGHCIIGEWTNLGAGSVFSNLKNTYGTIRVQTAVERVESGQTKLGSFVGDLSKVSIGTEVFAGKTLGMGSHSMGRISENIPDFVASDGGRLVELDLDSVIKTQERMMGRRRKRLSAKERDLIRFLHRAGEGARRKAGAVKGELGRA